MTEVLRYTSLIVILLCIPVFIWAFWDRRRKSSGKNNHGHTQRGYKVVKHRTKDDSQMANPTQ